MKQIEAVIFDWAGTVVDYGCMAPIHAMLDAFKSHDVNVSLAEIRQPMGMLKIDHIKAVLHMENVKEQFNRVYGRKYCETDIETIYKNFEDNIFATLHEHTKLIPGVLTVQKYLRDNNIKLGSTTGYTSKMVDIVAKETAKQGYCPDSIVSADQVKYARPYPYMIFKNLENLKICNIQQVLKVGDTLMDIEEGLNAGCLTVGVLKGSSMLGLTEEEVNKLASNELENKLRQIKYEMLEAGADFVINSIDELPSLIELLN